MYILQAMRLNATLNTYQLTRNDVEDDYYEVQLNTRRTRTSSTFLCTSVRMDRVLGSHPIQ